MTMALEIRNLTHAFGGVTVLRDVSFALPAGGFAVLLGPNGAGKTTLFSLVSGLYSASCGEIHVFEHDLRRAPTLAMARMGILFQQPTLDLDLTVSENLRYHAALHGLSPSEGRLRAERVLRRLDILPHAHRVVRHLSGGERRRVEIARALLHDPQLLLFDEPTAGLDTASRKALLAHARDLCAQSGIAVLWATHLLDEVADDDHAMLLEKGVVIRNGRTGDIGSVHAEAGP
ncbi:ATP-binding cassette domain-containing protein [Mesorhizobium sp. BR1-1-16]|uniref:ATP-binding cassette domain-containing protein n=1 Tax=Mesorhizobium sp. BR1-1-16 TaxID=2876653 RepID=UPI001CCEF5B1|nr:ATP-binding cassette domain-containing protein [Mesorhizobium sp. BR1-1-16]MBZ9936995.1 ATP-binding cassette domain-containing protein [Mesorhizobium sp. BR1-1-16]